MHRPQNQTQLKRAEASHKLRRTLSVTIVALGIFSIIVCGYGHAALSTSLQISGEATVKWNDNTFGITYMQEMTSEICSRTKVGVEEQLIDIRDKTKYWVRKVPNGSCWMMQNLGYVITNKAIENKEINSITTDLNTSDAGLYESTVDEDGKKIYYWTSNSNYPPQSTEIIDEASGSVTKVADNQKGTYSWFFGSKFDTLPRPDAFVNDPTYNMGTACTNNKNILFCSTITEARFYNAGDYSYAKTGKVYDAETKIYDSHFNVGTYYQFNTITAGSAGTRTSQNMPSSLCPKGWRLPLGGSGDTSSNKSLYNLLTTYGYKTGHNGTYDGRTRNVSQDPVYFIRTGYILPSATNAAQYMRLRGYLWTAYGGTTAQGVYARVSGTSLERRSNDSRYYGFPARCVAR